MEPESLVWIIAFLAAVGLIGFAKDLLVPLSQIFGSPLHEAIRTGKTDKARALIEKGADLDALDTHGRSPLRHALEPHVRPFDDDNWKIAGMLLQHGADPNRLCEDGVKPSDLVGSGILDKLIQDGYLDPEREFGRGKTMLHIAAELGNKEVFEKYLGVGTNINCQDDLGLTPLMLAAINKHFELAVAIVERGADVNIRNKDGSVALMAATESPALVKALIKGGADVNVREEGDEWTALHYAAFQGHVGSVRDLIDAGAAAYLVEASGLTALQFAESQNHRAIVKFLNQVS